MFVRIRQTAVVAAAILFSISVPDAANADTCTWTGAGPDSQWSTPANWSCSGAHVTPQNGDSLVFPLAGTQLANVNDVAGLVVETVSVADAYQLTGNGIFLNQSVQATADQSEVLLPITLNATATIGSNNISATVTFGDIDLNGHALSISTNSQALNVDGTITGDGSITKSGVGAAALNGANDYTGITTIAGGVLAANSDTALGAIGAGNHTLVQTPTTLWIGPGRSIAEPLMVDAASLAGGLLLMTGTSTLTGAIHFFSAAAVSVVTGADLTLTGVITSEPGVVWVKSGLGTVTVSNTGNSWAQHRIDLGVLRLGAAGVLPDTARVQVQGTLDLNGHDETIGALLGPANGVVALGNNTLTVTQDFNANFNGVITGTGGLTKAGGAMLTLDGAVANTYTGTTTVTAGELRLAKTGGATAIAGPLVVNGGSVTYNLATQQIADTAAVTVNAPGSMSLGGGAGSTEIIGSLAGDGTITLTDHTLIVGTNNQSTVFSGVIGGADAFLNKYGTGTLTLTGNNNTIDGTTFISGGGGLIVNGTLSSVIFPQSGLLGGAGAVGIISAPSGIGTIAPGPGIGGAGTGILSTPVITLGGAMIVAIDLNGATPGAGYDRIASAGQVILGNASLLLSRGYTPAANTTFTIIDNGSASPVVGTFASLPQNTLMFVDGHPFRISYTGGDGNDIVLTALAQPAFSISDVTVAEGDSGSVNAVFTVSTPTTPFQTVSVQFATVNGTAASPQDYTAHSGTLTFLPGTTSQTVTIAVHGDDVAEATETFIVRLSNAQGGATIAHEDGAGTIETDDEAPTPLTYFLAEGATGPFFDNDILIANPNAAEAPVTLTFFTQQGTVIAEQRTILARSRATIHVDQISGLEDASVSVEVKSTSGLPLTVERTMFWDASYYGGHTGTAVEQAAVRWFFAEAAQGFFDTYVLVTNANTNPADVTVTFLREGETPVIKTVSVGASSRATIGAGDYPELAGRSFGLIVDATQPVIAERAMYFGSTPTRLWSGGHESPGVTQPSTSWFHAEGATGTFFDTFILLGNPQDDPAKVTLDFLLESGETVTVQRDVPAKGRVTVPIEALDDPRLQAGAVSTVVTSDRPIVSERSTYWSADASPWGEGHNSFGVTQTATSWGLAEGRVGGTHQFATFILLANPSMTTAAEVSVTYLREGGTPVVRTYQVPAASRFTIDASTVPELRNQSFGAKIEVTNAVPIAVERSMYWNANGVFWAGGSHAPAQRLP